MKFGPQHYFSVTPKKIVQLADAIVGASVFAGSIASLNGHPITGTVVFIAGVVAKTASNFFGEEVKEESVTTVVTENNPEVAAAVLETAISPQV